MLVPNTDVLVRSSTANGLQADTAELEQSGRVTRIDQYCTLLGSTLLTDLRDSLTFCTNDYNCFTNYAADDANVDLLNNVDYATTERRPPRMKVTATCATFICRLCAHRKR
jgi:hypothetical protein